MKKPNLRQLTIGLLSVLVAALLLVLFTQDAAETDWPLPELDLAEEISLSEAYRMIQDAEVATQAAIVDSYLYVLSQPHGETLVTLKARLPYPAHDIITDLAKTSEIPLQIHRNPGYDKTLSDWIFQLLPLVLLIVLVIILFGGRGLKSLGLNTSFQVIDPAHIQDSFDTVAGIDSARGEIQEIVSFLKDPKAAARLGGRMPKGAIFSGPPGTGKTLLARAMAREAGVPFIAIEAAGINQLFVGAGAMKIKRAFREARKQAPCIVFIDEIDAMGRARGGSHSSAGDEKETTLNALLVELDGFDSRDGVVVIAATNRPEILDKALTRRGRIDRHIHVDLPDLEGRAEILAVHVRDILAAPGLDLRRIAGSTFGFSGADLRALVNEAALCATRAGRKHVTPEDFDAARDRMVVGLAGSQRRLSDADRRKTAVHEAGHALIAGVLPEADRIEKASILPQGAALGYVMQSADEDRAFETRDRLLARIRVAVAGRVAEELVYGPGGITSGAASDVAAATRVARAMVTQFGMSRLGFVQIDPQDATLMAQGHCVLEEVRNLIAEQIAQVSTFISAHRTVLEEITELLEREETVSGVVLMERLAPLRGSFQDQA